MSIYAEHAHGMMSDEEFRSAVADEEWLYKCRTEETEAKWIRSRDYNPKENKWEELWVCSECGEPAVADKRTPFCPWCGESMENASY